MRYSELNKQVQSIRITVDNGTATLIELTVKVNDFISTTSEYTLHVYIIYYIYIYNLVHYAGQINMLALSPIDMSLPVIQSQITTSLQYISEANSTYNAIKYETHPKLLSDADQLKDILANTTATAIEAMNIVIEANETATQAMDEFYTRKDMLEEAESVSDSVGTALWEAGTDLSNLLAKLEEAEAAAESVSIIIQHALE